jgi:hypothetical protein
MTDWENSRFFSLLTTVTTDLFLCQSQRPRIKKTTKIYLLSSYLTRLVDSSMTKILPKAFLALRRSLADAYRVTSSNTHMFGGFIDTSFKALCNAPSMEQGSSAGIFQGSNLFDPYLRPGMKDVPYDDKQKMGCRMNQSSV